jgi:F0F1-type ATP synthase membrane subunit a
MKLILKRTIFLLMTLTIIISFVYLFKIKEEKTNKVPKSATLVFNYMGEDINGE